MALLACLVSLLYLVVNPTMNDDVRIQLGPPIVSGLAYAVPLWLNHRRHYWHATTFLCLATLVLQLSFVFALGYASGNHFFMLPLLGGIPLTYPPRHRRTVATLMVAVLGVFITIVLAGSAIRPLVAFDADAPAVYNTLALMLVPVLIAYVSYYSHRRMTIAESSLEARSRELAAALAELKLAQAQMIDAANQVMLARLMAGLLHEVNTPLGSIRSGADTLKRALARCRTFERFANVRRVDGKGLTVDVGDHAGEEEKSNHVPAKVFRVGHGRLEEHVSYHIPAIGFPVD